MSWTTANIELDDNQTKKTQKKKNKKNSDVNELTIRGGLPSINLSQLGTSTI